MTAIAIGSECWVLDTFSRPRDDDGNIDHRAQGFPNAVACTQCPHRDSGERTCPKK